MNEASRRQDYEQAAHWRDLIRTIEQVREKPRLISVALEDIDIWGFAEEADRVAVYVFFMRRGKVREAEEIVRRESVDKQVEALLAQVLEDFYRDSKDLPAKILLPCSPASLADFAAALSARKGKTIKMGSLKKEKKGSLSIWPIKTPRSCSGKAKRMSLRRENWPAPCTAVASGADRGIRHLQYGRRRIGGLPRRL